jgi:hypothetical protein
MSRNLLHETRLIKKQPLDPRSEVLVGDMERILIKVANSEHGLNSPDLQLIRNGIERQNLLHKIRRAEVVYNPQYMMLASDKER